MNRKEFLTSTLLGGIGGGFGISKVHRSVSNIKLSANQFKLNYAPKFGTFSAIVGNDLIDQLEFIKEVGFRGLTDDGMKYRSLDQQTLIGKTLERLDLHMGVMGAHKYFWDKPQLVLGDEDINKSFLEEIRSTIEVAKRVNAKWLTVMPGRYVQKLEFGYQTANVVEVLKRASSILEPHNLVMVIEPVNRNYPGLFLTTISQAFAICKAVDSPSCKILNDLYHQQITEGNLIHNIDKAWDEIGIFQVGDNPGRNEPLTGEINFKNIFKHLYKKGYKGLIGMEHANSIAGKEGALAVIEAYKQVDDFTE